MPSASVRKPASICPGEAKGILFNTDDVGLLEQSTTGFGQGISVTAIQLVTAFCAIVNGGTLYQPYITKAILHPTTKDPIVEVKPNAVRQVISEDTSFKMRYALESVVALGGAQEGRISTATRSAARPEPPRRRRTVRI